VTALALATDAQRLRPGYPPRGSYLSLSPNVEICRMATAVAPTDTLTYVDERVSAVRSLPAADLTMVHAGIGCHTAARRFAASGLGDGMVVFFGPQATAWGDSPPEPIRHTVLGDAALAWPELRPAIESGTLPRVCRALPAPGYVQPDWSIARVPGLDARYQAIQFARGCGCPAESAAFCPERLYFEDAVRLRGADEVIGEVISLPGKLVHVLDDDVAAVPDYYTDLFRLLWHYRRHWTVRASVRLFRHPELIQALSRGGTRVVTLDESFLRPLVRDGDLSDGTVRALYRGVKALQSSRMLVGATVTLPPGEVRDRRPLLAAIRRSDLDFLKVRNATVGADAALEVGEAGYAPNIPPTDLSWVKGGFYSMGGIFDRTLRRPRRVGFYNTLVYFLPMSLAGRQDFLEDITG
jgi:hypothetical protein